MGEVRQSTRVVLLIVACLSVPLCCLLICAVFPSYPMFWAPFSVVNESDETFYITPIAERRGQRRVALESVDKFPYAPLLKRGDVRLEPGEAVQIYCRGFDEPPWRLAAIVVRNERREYRQLVVDEATMTLMWASPERVYRIGAFDELAIVSGETRDFAQKARRLHLVAWAMIAAGFVPVGLFVWWLRLVWRSRAHSRKIKERQETGTETR